MDGLPFDACAMLPMQMLLLLLLLWRHADRDARDASANAVSD